MPSPDSIIEARWVVPVRPEHSVLEHHAVVVSAERITQVLPIEQARAAFPSARRTVLDEHVLIPGLINLHCHAAMTLLRGYADDLPLMRWLQERIWPAETRHLSESFCHDGTVLACAEMLSGGITCFSDMYFYPGASAAAAQTMGMRAHLGIVVLEFPTPYATDTEDYLHKGLSARDAWKGESLIDFTLSPHAPYTVSDAGFERILTLADQLDLPIHMHVHETQSEIEHSLQEHGMRPLARLQRLGLINDRLIAVHATQLGADEIELLARHGSAIAHCPSSNMKLASGIAPVPAMLQAGLKVGLGSDGAASNNRLDLFCEMRQAALLAKVGSGNAAALPAARALRMATLDAAQALGQDDRIGSIEAGKLADLVAVRLDAAPLQPCFDPVSHLVYAAGREHVSHVWVGGKAKVENGLLLHQHNIDLKAKAKLWHNRIVS